MAIAASLRAKGLFGAGKASELSCAKERATPSTRARKAVGEEDRVRRGACPPRPSMPLAFAGTGVEAVVLSVRGSKESCHHLENLGFVEGAHVKVVCEAAGNLIVEVKGSQVALDRQVAMKVSVGI